MGGRYYPRHIITHMYLRISPPLPLGEGQGEGFIFLCLFLIPLPSPLPEGEGADSADLWVTIWVRRESHQAYPEVQKMCAYPSPEGEGSNTKILMGNMVRSL